LVVARNTRPVSKLNSGWLSRRSIALQRPQQLELERVDLAQHAPVLPQPRRFGDQPVQQPLADDEARLTFGFEGGVQPSLDRLELLLTGRVEFGEKLCAVPFLSRGDEFSGRRDLTAVLVEQRTMADISYRLLLLNLLSPASPATGR
jgi:hypothetical protein